MTDKLPEVKVSLELLYHFNCPHCQGWWSIGDYKPSSQIYCPHCAVQSPVSQIVCIANEGDRHV